MSLTITLKKWLLACAWIASAATPLATHAGQTCETGKPTALKIQRGMDMAAKTMAALDASGEQVVVLARSGQDLSRYNVRYSHLAFAWRQPDGKGASHWRVLHKLNECGTASSSIYRQGLGEFFLDDPWRYEAAWVAPAPDMQTRLLGLLQEPKRAVAMQHKPYSIVSYAWGRSYQQSNQWLIETLAMAMEPDAVNPQRAGLLDARGKAQAWLQVKGYEPAK